MSRNKYPVWIAVAVVLFFAFLGIYHVSLNPKTGTTKVLPKITQKAEPPKTTQTQQAEPQKAEEQPTSAAPTQPEQQPTTVQGQKTSTEQGQVTQPVPVPAEPGQYKKVYHAQGVYVGRINEKYVKIEIDGNPGAFFYSGVVTGIQTGDDVNVDYFINDSQQKEITNLSLVRDQTLEDLDKPRQTSLMC